MNHNKTTFQSVHIYWGVQKVAGITHFGNLGLWDITDY